MDYDIFSARAHEAFHAIPAPFRDGVDGLVVRPERVPHPTAVDVFTLGLCLTEAYPSDWSGPETLRSTLVLFHGSFQALCEANPDFDWDAELWETLTHELRHHLESLARDDSLEGVDYAMGEAFHRNQGDEFDPLYFRRGLEVGPGIFQVEYDFFLEVEWSAGDLDDWKVIPFAWHGTDYRIRRPLRPGDIHFVWLKGLDVGPGTLQLVLVRRMGFTERLKKRQDGLEILESEACAEPVGKTMSEKPPSG